MSSIRFVTVRPKAWIALGLVAGVALAALPASAATSADLATTISGSPPHSLGYVYYKITVTNGGPGRAYNVAITDATPPRSTFYCASGTAPACGPAPSQVTCTPPTGPVGTVTCTTAELASGASATVWMGVKLGFFWHNQAFGDSATATSTTPDPNPANNTATILARVI